MNIEMAEKEIKKKTPRKSATSKSKKEEPISKLRIRVMAYEYKVLDLSVKQIIDTAMRYDAKIVGPIPLPTEIKKLDQSIVLPSYTKMLGSSLKCVFIVE